MSEYTDPTAGEPVPAQAGEALGAGPPPLPRRGSRPVIGPFTLRHLVLANSIIAVAIVVLFAINQPLGASGSGSPPNPQATFYRLSSSSQGLAIGQQAPELVGTSNGQQVGLTDLDGHPLTIAALLGRPVWINFWATWCPPCQHETPDLRAAYQAHKNDGLVLIAIDVQEEPGVVRDYVMRYGLGYTVGVDATGAIMQSYRVFGIPTQYFIDRNGVIRDRVFGPLTRDQMDQKIAEIMVP